MGRVGSKSKAKGFLLSISPSAVCTLPPYWEGQKKEKGGGRERSQLIGREREGETDEKKVFTYVVAVIAQKQNHTCPGQQ